MHFQLFRFLTTSGPRLALLFGLLAVLSCDAQASQIVYSWTGTVKKFGASDPWNIGAQKPFSLSVAVDSAGPDVYGGSLDGARFQLEAAALSIDGTPATSVGFSAASSLTFDDNLFGTFDQVFVSFNAEFNGVTLPFYAALRLPSSTFGFANTSALPPDFGSVFTSSSSGASGSSPYSGGTGSGVLVTSNLVPEPSAYALAACGILGLAVFRRRRSG